MAEAAIERESMEFDVVIVGAGPSGLAAAVRLRQLAEERDHDLSVCVVEKGSEVGAHILSGAVLEPRALEELLPDWRERGAPLDTPVSEERFLFLTGTGGVSWPTALLPPAMKNHGNYVISLGNFCRWLAAQAEERGAEVFPGFAAADVLYREDGAVGGIVTGDMGVGRDGTPTDNFMPGMELRAKYTFFAEGCRGHLGRRLMERFGLRDGVEPQTYGIGIKELWEVRPERHRPGLVVHTAGWPLDAGTYGGSFLYHLEDHQVAVGFVVGLDYENPWLSPFEEMQRFKTHPKIRGTFEGGRRIAYGARALNEGGLQCLPKLAFPGGVLVGCEAGTLNTPKIKGTHTAMKSGMLAAEAVFEAVAGGSEGGEELAAYPEAFRASWVWRELHAARNVRPGFRRGLWGGMLYSRASTTYVLARVSAPWTLRHGHADHDCAQPKASECRSASSIRSPDGVVSFDRNSSVFLSEHEPRGRTSRCTSRSEGRLGSPSRSISPTTMPPSSGTVPAGVYEIVQDGGDGAERLRINAQNCVHCKTCDIKDPTQNIVWVTPEGGGGPNYPNM